MTSTKRSAPRSSAAKPRAGRNDYERREQVSLFRWAALASAKEPDLRMMFAVPNGMAARSPITVRKMKAEGLRNGVLDVWLPIAVGSYHGLVLELKVPPNEMSQEQTWWAMQLRVHGWCVVAPCWGFEHARDAIEAYLLDGHMPFPLHYKEQLQRRYGLLRSRTKSGVSKGAGRAGARAVAGPD